MKRLIVLGIGGVGTAAAAMALFGAGIGAADDYGGKSHAGVEETARGSSPRPSRYAGEQRRQGADQAGSRQRLPSRVGDAGQLALQQIDEAGHPFGARSGRHRFHFRRRSSTRPRAGSSTISATNLSTASRGVVDKFS